MLLLKTLDGNGGKTVMNQLLKCPYCGYEFIAVVKSSKGVRCPKCRRKVYRKRRDTIILTDKELIEFTNYRIGFPKPKTVY